MQEAGVNLADLDDDEGNGLVSHATHPLSLLPFAYAFIPFAFLVV